MVDPTWKIQIASGSSSASSVSVPVIPIELGAVDPRGQGKATEVGDRAEGKIGRLPAALLYAAVRSVWACAATASAAWNDPIVTPGGNPVYALPGLTPRSVPTTVGPVLVTVWPPSTANAAAVPRLTGDATPLTVAGRANIEMARATTAIRQVLRISAGFLA